MVTVLAGVGGLGKSQWTALLAAENPGITLIATAEDSPSTTVEPRLAAVQADRARVAFVSIQSDDGLDDGITIPDDIETLGELVGEHGANLLIVDPLVAHLPGEIDSHKDQSVRRALAPLYRLAEARGCAVVAVMHLNKATGLAPLKARPAPPSPPTGKPAVSHALRPMLRLCSPAWVTQPNTTSSTCSGEMPARLMSSLRTSEPRTTGCISLSFPFRRPIGVRTASTITASRICQVSLVMTFCDPF